MDTTLSNWTIKYLNFYTQFLTYSEIGSQTFPGEWTT